MKNLSFAAFGLVAILLLPSLSLAATRTIAVANEGDGTISFIDIDKSELISSVDTAIGGGKEIQKFAVHNVQSSSRGDFVWVTAPPFGHDHGHGDEYLIGIAVETRKVTSRINLGRKLHVAHVVLAEDGSTAYVTAYEDDSILVVDLIKSQIERKISLRKGSGPHGQRICGNRLFVANMKGKSLAIVDLTNDRIEYIPVQGMAVQTACTADGKKAYVSLFDTREIAEYDTVKKNLKKISLPKESKGPVQILLGQGGRLWVADQGILLNRPASNSLYLLDPKSGVVQTINVGNGAHGISSSGDKVFVTNVNDNSVSVVAATDSRNVLKTIPVGKKPNGITFIAASSPADRR